MNYQQMEAIDNINPFIYFKIDLSYKVVEEMKKRGLKFFFNASSAPSSLSLLEEQIILGTTDIYVCDDLCYNLEYVKNICEKNNVQTRLILNEIPSKRFDKGINPKAPIFIPECIEELSKYIDVGETKEKTKKVHEVNGLFFTVMNKFAKWIILAVFLVIFCVIVGKVKSYQTKVVEDANKIVSITKNKYNDNFSSCNEIDGAYYIVFNTKSIERMGNIKLDNDYEGYIKIVRVDNKYDYYINLKVGQFGIMEKNIEKVSSWDVLPYFGVEMDTITDSNCR